MRLEASGVAPEHARIRVTDVGVQIEDRGTTTGTFVNGYRIGGYFLASGDLIGFGPALEYEVEMEAEEGPPSVACRRCGVELSSLVSRERRDAKPQHCGACSLLVSSVTPSEADVTAARSAAIASDFPRELAVNYEYLGLLGEGGQGRVFKLKNRTTGQLVAAKQLLGTNSRALARFEREAEALKRLTHPHIVSFLGFVDSSSGPLMIMSFADGPSLSSLIEGQGALDPKFVFRTGVQVASALAHMAERGVVHRDIKPSNILIARGDEAKLTDFGFVRMADAGTKITMSGTWIGTPYYMAPEQLKGEELDGRIDVWGLGVTLYHALLGKLPFAGANQHVIFKKILFDPIDPAGLIKRIGNRDAGILLALLEKDRNKRPAPAKALDLLRSLA
jgi:serine/threonine protein kinase